MHPKLQWSNNFFQSCMKVPIWVSYGNNLGKPMWETLCKCPYEYQNIRGENIINVGNICKFPYGSPGHVWDQPGQTHVGNIMWMPIWVSYGNSLGKPMCETYGSAHMNINREQPGQTHMWNISKCPYGSNMGTSWADPCGETYQNAHMGYTWKQPGKTRVGNICVRAPMGISWDQPGQTHVGNMCKCPYAYLMGTTWANPCGKHRKHNVDAHMSQIWEQSGQTHVENICKCPYGFHMGITWANPCGKHNFM